MDFLVPKLSATMESAKVLRWLKQAGDKVKLGEPLVELETDKAAMEVEAPADGTLESILAPEGTELPIGATLGRLSSAAQPAAAAKPTTAAPPMPARAIPQPTASQVPKPSSRPAASPLARRLAAEAGLDLSRLTPASGPRLRKRDIIAALANKPGAAAVRLTAGAGVTPMRLRIAEAVALSRRTIPSFTLDRWVEAGAINRAREQLNAVLAEKLTLTDFLLKAMAETLTAQPTILDRWFEDSGKASRVAASAVDIGLVVAVPDGMLIPTLPDLAGKTLVEIGKARRALVERVRTGTVSATDSKPAAIALSNLGKSGVDRFDAIINPGQSSILAVGREQERVIARNGAPVVATGFNLTFAVDHRLIDGVAGAAFLSALADRIETGGWTLDR